MSCENCEESAYVIDKLAKLLAEIAVIVNGPEPPLTRWSYHDLPEKVRALRQAQHPAAAVPDEVAKHSTQDCYEHFLAYSGLEDSPWIKYAYFHGADVGLDRPSKPAPVAPAAAVPDVDWRELYRIQTAMRYMDNNPGLTRDHAFSWADQEVADAERAMLAAARKGES